MYRRRKWLQEQLRLQKAQKNKFFLEEGEYRVLCMGVHSTLLYFLGKNCIIYFIRFYKDEGVIDEE